MTELKPFRWVQDRIIELAESNPDNVAECRYFHNEGLKPVCIVGHVLAELGARQVMEINQFGCDSWRVYNSDMSSYIAASTRAGGIPWTLFGVEEPTEVQRTWLTEVQREQDAGHSWGWAVERAMEFA